ncbi:MAG: hypothetical protein ACREQW_01285 [Candidatus Binatia bacterium]
MLFAIPLVLVIIGMILNNLSLAFDQPASSSEQDPAKRSAAEKRAYQDFFSQQRMRFLKRQARVGHYAWLVLAVFVVSFGWLYFDTVNKTTALNQISAIETMRVEEGKEMVLALTLRDGSNVKYLIKSEKIDPSGVAAQEGHSKALVSKWELSGLGTALSIGDGALPNDLALKISN